MLEDQIRQDLTTALKAGQRQKADVLRMLLSAGGYRRIEAGRELTDRDWTEVVSREVKKRREAADSFRAGRREEQAAAEEEEMKILLSYLPAMLTEEEVRQEAGKMQLPADFGVAMKMAAPVFKGRAEGAVVAKVVKELTEKYDTCGYY